MQYVGLHKCTPYKTQFFTYRFAGALRRRLHSHSHPIPIPIWKLNPIPLFPIDQFPIPCHSHSHLQLNRDITVVMNVFFSVGGMPVLSADPKATVLVRLKKANDVEIKWIDSTQKN